MDIPQLAAEVAKFLAPFLPYLIAGTKAAAEEAGKQFGKAAWDKAVELWDKIWGKAKKKESAKEAIEDVTQHPTDEDAQAAFRRQLIKLMEADEKLLNFIAERVTIENMVNIGGNVEASTFLIGKGNQVINAQTYVQGNVYNGPAPRNPEDALKVYRAVMANMTKNLSLQGIDPKASDVNEPRLMGLANVYIELNTTSPLITVDTSQKIHRTLQAYRVTREETLSVLEAIIAYKSLVIKGDPGSGKSTFVNYLTYCLSAELAARLKGWDKVDSNLLPVIVVLRDFIKSFKKLPEKAEPRHIWDFIEKRLKDQNLSPALKPVQELLEKGNVIVFFDGLDEVTTIPQRLFVRDAVHAFVKRYEKNRFVVTCRVLSYTEPKEKEPDLRLAKFPEFELAQFDEKQIEDFIERWYAELTNLGSMTMERAHGLGAGLKTQIGERTELNKLAGNPLLLTIMAVVNTDEGQLPDSRAKLYETIIEKLLWQWEQSSKGKDVARLRQLLQDANCSDADLKGVIWKLAYEAHAQTDTTNEDDESLTGISELTLQKALAALNHNDLNWAESVIEAMKLRAGLLLERETGLFTFPHRSFQEFLGGTYIETQDDFVSRAAELADNQLLWRQVILWAVSRRVFLRGSNDGPLALAAELCPRRELKEKEWSRVWLAGDILLEVGINRAQRSDFGRELLPHVKNRLVELMEGSHLTPRERTEAADTLARLGDPRPGVTTNFAFCQIPAGTFKMGNTEETDPTSYEDERPQFDYTIPHAYFMSRYPVTNAQFEEFIKDPQGYTNDTWWTKAGLEWRKDRREHNRYGGAFAFANHPVVGVTWYEATAFCNWLTNRFQVSNSKLQVYDPKTRSIVEDNNLKLSIENRKSIIRLPTEAEWERAARGGHGYRYPWKSDEITPDHANYDETNLNVSSAVGAFPKGMNDFGLLDMSGNVLEWCATAWQENYDNYLQNEKKSNEPEGDVPRVLRGGAFHNLDWFVRCACRFRYLPGYRRYNLGFRCVVVSHFS